MSTQDFLLFKPFFLFGKNELGTSCFCWIEKKTLLKCQTTRPKEIWYPVISSRDKNKLDFYFIIFFWTFELELSKDNPFVSFWLWTKDTFLADQNKQLISWKKFKFHKFRIGRLIWWSWHGNCGLKRSKFRFSVACMCDRI